MPSIISYHQKLNIKHHLLDTVVVVLQLFTTVLKVKKKKELRIKNSVSMFGYHIDLLNKLINPSNVTLTIRHTSFDDGRSS